MFCSDKQFKAAEEAASQATELFPEKGEKFRVRRCHRVLGDIQYSKGEMDRAIVHFDIAFEIASSFDWHDQLF